MKLLFFITPLFFTFSSYSQLPCDCDASNVIDLKNCLAEPTYDVICIVDNFNLDDPSVTLPLVVLSGQTLQGNYNLINNPEGFLVYSSHKADYCYCYDSQNALYCPGNYLL